MLNSLFSRRTTRADLSRYVLADDASRYVTDVNTSFATGHEQRTQLVYTDELWLKLRSLKLDGYPWHESSVLDVCCGTGFFSYHLLQRVRVHALTLLDISETELEAARELLTGAFPTQPVQFVRADALASGLPDSAFDIVIGNSFLHHFSNVPGFLSEAKRLLRPGGVFASLHEPTAASTAVESRNPMNLLLYVVKGDSYLDYLSDKYFRTHPDKEARESGGADVWVFKPEDLTRLCLASGFTSATTASWHFVRPLATAMLSMHLTEERPRLGRWQVGVTRAAIGIDRVLRRVLPENCFGSAALRAEAPTVEPQ